MTPPPQAHGSMAFEEAAVNWVAPWPATIEGLRGLPRLPRGGFQRLNLDEEDQGFQRLDVDLGEWQTSRRSLEAGQKKKAWVQG